MMNERQGKFGAVRVLTAMFLLLLVASLPGGGLVHAQSGFSVVHYFSRYGSASVPTSGVFVDSDGTLYGMSLGPGQPQAWTAFGVTANDGFFWSGQVPSGQIQGSGPGECQGFPMTKSESGDSRFYGVTYDGGAFQRGSIFSIKTDLQTGGRILHEFTGPDGAYPNGPLLLANDGNFYGTTQNAGTVFRLTPNGKFTTLHVFRDDEGGAPNGSLIQASDGNLYGTTIGTVFRMTLLGSVTTIHAFSPNGPGGLKDGVVQASDGYLYGRTWSGPWGIFRLWLDGSGFETIHLSTVSGVGYCGALVEGPDQNLYGTVVGDPIADQGTIFRVTPTGSYSVLFVIDRFFRPYGPLALGPDRALYGTTAQAGNYAFPGTVFRFAIP